MFPSERFAQAGASPEQLQHLQAEYDQMPPAAQLAYDERAAGLAVGDLAAMIALAEPAQMVSDFTKADLQAAAADQGVEVSSSATKTDIAQAIVADQARPAPVAPVVVPDPPA